MAWLGRGLGHGWGAWLGLGWAVWQVQLSSEQIDNCDSNTRTHVVKGTQPCSSHLRPVEQIATKQHIVPATMSKFRPNP